MSNNLSTVQQIFACFGQGDIPGIIAKLADDVTFFSGSDPKATPFGGEFKGKDGAMRFFVGLGSTTQTTSIVPSNFREEGDKVLHDMQQDGIVTATGHPFSIKVLFTWTFNDAGQVADWKGTGDYSSLNAAFR